MTTAGGGDATNPHGGELHHQPDLPASVRGALNTIAADGTVLEKQLKRVDHRSFQFYSDEPARLGGEDAYPSPLGYLVGAATVCLLTQVKLYAGMTKVEPRPVMPSSISTATARCWPVR